MASRKLKKPKEIVVSVSGMKLNRSQEALINALFSSQVVAVLQHWNVDGGDGGTPKVTMEIGDPKIVSKK